MEASMAGEGQVRVFSSRDLREMDRLAAAEFGMPTLLLMEHAAMAIARIVKDGCDSLKSQRILFVCGPGNNGGDGHGAARLLLDQGVRAHVVLAGGEPREGTDAWTNLQMARSFGVPVHAMHDRHVKELFEQADLLVDCVFGTGLSRAPEGEAMEAIERLNAARDRGAFVFAVDVPSGMDADLGLPLGACVRANVTISLTGSKVGYVSEAASAAYTGWVLATPIGMPPALLARYGQMVALPRGPKGGGAKPAKAKKVAVTKKKATRRRVRK
jgi:NAD(P)H-hydrate epimerase